MREGIYRKTDAGRDEIRDRARRLSPPLRTVLLMVDGQRSLAQLREVAAGMKAPDDALEVLLAEGLVELVPSGFDAAGLMGALGPRPASRPPTVVLADVAAAANVVPTPTPMPMPAPAGEAPTGAEASGAGKSADGQSAQYLFLHGRMTEAVRAHLGLRGYFMQLKVERCGDAAGLRALLPELRGALAKAKGESFASDWERTLELSA